MGKGGSERHIPLATVYSMFTFVSLGFRQIFFPFAPPYRGERPTSAPATAMLNTYVLRFCGCCCVRSDW